MIYVWQYYEYDLDCEYSRVLYMLGLHMLLNKISLINVCQGSEYASNFESASVAQGFVHIPRILSMLGLE